MFELNFRDERYMPFEGAGAICKWRIELFKDFRQFDYNTISDVIIHLRYTAVDGGGKLKTPAVEALQGYFKSIANLSQEEGLFAYFDLKHEFSNEWNKAMQLTVGTEKVLNLNNLNDRLPVFTKGKQVTATDIYLLTSPALSSASINEEQFGDGASDTEIKVKVIHEKNITISNWSLKFVEEDNPLEKAWLIFRYVLK